MVKKDQTLASPRSDCQSQQHPAPPVRFNAKFTRTFVDLHEEAISVMTEIEDDDHTLTGFHSALPLEVHGTAYQPMAMISNAKVCLFFFLLNRDSSEKKVISHFVQYD